MKFLTTLLVFCSIASWTLGRSLDEMTYEQMWNSSDSVFIGRIIRVEPLTTFKNPERFGKDWKLRCYVLTIEVSCVLKGAKKSTEQIRSYDYDFKPSGDMKKDILPYVNGPSFIGNASWLLNSDCLWFLANGEPVTGQMDPVFSIVQLKPNGYNLAEPPSKAAKPATPGIPR